MATVLTSSQQTFVDITDQRKLSAYITSNLPKTQSENPNVLPHTYAPSWATTSLVLTPVVFLDQTSIPLNSTGLTISWKRKDGASAETSLTSGESVTDGILTVSADKLAESSSGMLTYICYISYYDTESRNTVISPTRWCGTRRTPVWPMSPRIPMCSSIIPPERWWARIRRL